MKHIFKPIDKNYLCKPLRIFIFIYFNVFRVFIKSVIGIIVFAAALFLFVMVAFTSFPILLDVSIYLIGFMITIPLVISMEEFFHLATCIARGKKDTVQGLLIGYWGNGKAVFMPLFVAVHYYGKFNIIDRFYISEGGPLTTLLLAVSTLIASVVLGAGKNIVTILAVLAVVPLIGLIPNKVIIQSDGYSIYQSAKKLNMSLLHAICSILAGLKYPLAYCIFPKQRFEDAYVDQKEAFEQMEGLISQNRNEEAIEIYRLLLKINPFDSLIINNLAWLYYKTGNFKEAYKLSKKALRLDPSDNDLNDTYMKIREVLTSCSKNLI